MSGSAGSISRGAGRDDPVARAPRNTSPSPGCCAALSRVSRPDPNTTASSHRFVGICERRKETKCLTTASDQGEDILLEALPDDVIASMETRDRWVATQPFEPGGFEFLVSDLQAWTPGQTVRVAFLGGSTELYQKIEEATKPITDAANLTLSFKDGNTYRKWTENDTEYAGEIRVSFDQGGYFSLVGTDSASQVIGWRRAGRRPPEPAQPQPRRLRPPAAADMEGHHAA